MKLITSSQMRKIDNECVSKYIPELILMENAGFAVTKNILKHFPDISGKSLLICCGSGNNGGDGFVIARQLLNHAKNITVYFHGSEKELKGSASKNFSILKNLGINFTDTVIGSYDIIVDALVGTGYKNRGNSSLIDVINKINAMEAFVIAVDIPTGVSSDTGAADTAVISDITVTFHKAKPGHFLYPGKEFCGRLIIEDIGIPHFIENVSECSIFASDNKSVSITPRRRTIHKSQCGRVLVVAGSSGFSGAAYMTAQAALMSGAGLVTLAVPASIHDIMEQKTTEVMTLPLISTEEGAISEKAYHQLSGIISSGAFDVLAIGPGLRRNESTVSFVKKIISEADIPMVIDADALFALSSSPDIINNKNVILTPHEGEFERLLGRKMAKTRIEEVMEYPLPDKAVLLLKGADTIISDGLSHYINTTGNPGMAAGGSGDILTGIIASFAAQGYDLLTAARYGAFIHGYAGDMLKESIGEYSVTPLGMLEIIGKALKNLE